MRKYRESGRNEMDSQRELLDSLMGVNRNNDRMQDNVTDFRDDRVCKFYLTGMCPNDIFVNTKMDEGPCPKIHSEDLKAQFAKSKDIYMYDSLIERQFISRINDADRIIKKARVRVEEDLNDESVNPDINPEIIRINKILSKLVTDAEKAGEAGDIDTAMELILVRYDHLTQEKAAHMSKINEALKKKNNGNDKKLRVCDVCGSYLSLYDSDKRLQDHFLGKQHIGFQYMRDALDQIKARREERRLKEKDNSNSGEISSLTAGTSSNNANNSGAAATNERKDRDNNNRYSERDSYNSKNSGSSRGGRDDYYGSRDDRGGYKRDRDYYEDNSRDYKSSNNSYRSRRSNSRDNNRYR